MNDQRRRTIDAFMARIAASNSSMKLHHLELMNHHHVLDMLRMSVKTVRDNEQEYLDNMPEAFQTSEHGDQAQAAIMALEAAYISLSQAMDKLDGVLIVNLPGTFDMLMSTMESLTAAKK